MNKDLESVQLCRRGINSLRLEVDESIVQHINNLVETAFTDLLKHHMHPEPQPIENLFEMNFDIWVWVKDTRYESPRAGEYIKGNLFMQGRMYDLDAAKEVLDSFIPAQIPFW
jgi:hypothetical protein